MFPGLDPKKIQAVMKQLGVKQEEIPAQRVVIEQENKNIIIENPSIQKVNMQGSVSFQISGEISEESKSEEISEDDIALVAEKTSKSKAEAKQALEASNGDIAEAIMKLS